MEPRDAGVAQQIAQAARAFESTRTGHAPQSVTVVLGDDAVVVTLRGALSPAERSLATSPEAAAQLQEFHRQLFTASSEPLRREIQRITGVEVREATAELVTAGGAVLHVFTAGTLVQVFLLARGVPAETWSDGRAGENSQDQET